MKRNPGDPPEASIVVPVYKNKDTLEELYDRLSVTLTAEGLSYEVIFVDDASPDESLALLKQLAQQHPEIAVIAMGGNVGQSRALLVGLSRTLGRWIVTLDADLQDPPEAVPDLLAKLREGKVVVFGGRYGRYESLSRLATSRLYKWLQHRLANVPIDAGLFLAMDRSAADILVALDQPFIVPTIGLAGLSLTSIPVKRDTRPSNRSSYSSWKRLKTGYLAIGWILAWRRHAGRMITDPPLSELPVSAYIGARFSPSGQQAPSERASVREVGRSLFF